ncbi:hypothetical protein SBRCBS47491_002480 [Sporothrix bragantina]|uniref:FAD/NAD(P)-binding domain-containing protein n=1 Tax=Sporothrix bragantina TaxID=671064 RepID=A0ABP0B751_9PEZI
MAPTVVVLGGAYGGLHVAHYLLKNNKEAKVVLVSKTSHFFWNLASVRAIIAGTIQDKQMFVSLADALSRYPKDRVELIVGSAEAVDTTAKTVKVSVPGAAERSFAYDQLVLATGSRNTQLKTQSVPGADNASPIMPWKADNTYEDYLALLHSTQEKVKAAKHIVVAGGGSTGVEVASELGYAFAGKSVDKGGKEIVLLSSGEVLGGDTISGSARNELKKLHVDVRTTGAVTAARTLPDGRTELTVAGASEPVVTDLFLATVGLTPNTDYLDAKLLNAKKYVEVDEFFRVKGVAENNVWAVGDVVSKPRAGFIITQKQAGGAAKNIDLVLKGKAPQPVKGFDMDILAVATGPSRGVGRFGSWRLPSLAVWLAKGRTLGVQMTSSYVDGSVA